MTWTVKFQLNSHSNGRINGHYKREKVCSSFGYFFFWNFDNCLVIYIHIYECAKCTCYIATLANFSQIRFNVIALNRLKQYEYEQKNSQFYDHTTMFNATMNIALFTRVVYIMHLIIIIKVSRVKADAEKKFAAFFLLIIVSWFCVKKKRFFFSSAVNIIHLYLSMIFRPIVVHHL